MRPLLTLALLTLSLTAHGAAFPYITLNQHTNRVSDNGAALTFNGTAIGGANWTPTNTPANSSVLQGAATANTYIWSIPGFDSGPLFHTLVTGSTTNMYGFINPFDPDNGGLSIAGYAKGDVARVLIRAANGDTNILTDAVMLFTVYDEYPDGDASPRKTIFGFDNDFTHYQNGRYALQVWESHGGYQSGYPDSVAFAGINTGRLPDDVGPDAVFHALNPTTANDDTAKTNIVSLFEGRADQVGDLAQWKLTGGPTLLSVPKSGGIGSYATDATLYGTANGWTNTFGKNATFRADGTLLVYTVYNNAATAIYTNTVPAGHFSEQIQASGKILITSGTVSNWCASPF